MFESVTTLNSNRKPQQIYKMKILNFMYICIQLELNPNKLGVIKPIILGVPWDDYFLNKFISSLFFE